MKSSTYHFHVQQKILADFRFCISVPLSHTMFEFDSQRIFLCFTAMNITKPSQESRNFFGADISFHVQVLWVPSWNKRSFLSLGLENSIFRNIRNILRVFFFLFFWLENSLLKYKRFFRVSVSWNIRKFRFLKYKEFFVVSNSRNIRKDSFEKM